MKKLNLENVMNDISDDLLKNKDIRHVTLSVESLDSSFKYAIAKGVARQDGTLMDVDTPFWIASITKLFIASIILKFHESKKLNIDDFLTNYLPEQMLKGVHVIDKIDQYNKLTIRHLLSHSSGIHDYLEIKSDKRKTIVDEIIEGDDMSWTIDDVLKIIREAKSPLFKPQVLTNSKYKIRYSDTNFQILIAIIEKISNQSIEEVFKEYLYKPLNLNNTFHPGGEPLGGSKEVATVWIKDIPFDNKPRAMRSFGDLNSTLGDLTEFMRALISGRVFEKEETFKMMTGVWQTFGIGFSLLAPGWPMQYSLGMMRLKLPKVLTSFKQVPDLIGHTGATGSWLFYCEELQLIFAGTVDQITAAPVPFKVVPKLVKAYIR